jgi:hypothetical protein
MKFYATVRVACQHGKQDENWHEFMSAERDSSNSSAIGFWIIVAVFLIAVLLAVLLKDAAKSIGKIKLANMHCQRVVWQILVFADEHGRFPVSEDELIETQIRESLTDYLAPHHTGGRLAYPVGLPSSHLQYSEAGGQTREDWHLKFLTSLPLVKIQWNSDSTKAPVVTFRNKEWSTDNSRGNDWLAGAEAALLQQVHQDNLPTDAREDVP